MDRTGQRGTLFAGNDAAANLADATQAVAGATGTAAWSSGSNDWIAATVALAPSSGPTYYYRLRSVAGTLRSGDSDTASS
jgi:hypothetical protein